MTRGRKPSVQRYHDRVAGRYDASYDDAYWQWHDALTWEHLKASLPSDQSVPLLDLGCGTGKWGLKLLKSGFSVTFVDISMGMVEQARRLVDEMGAAARAAFVHADLMDLSALPKESFALAVAFGEPIGCAADPGKALWQIFRVLRPGGLLVATFDNRLACSDYYLETSDIEGLDVFLKTGVTHWLTRDQKERFPIHTYTPTQLRKLLDGAGFEVLDMIGKTVLPLRHHRELLEDGEQRRRLARLEQCLWRDPAAIGRSAHLQVAARRKT